VNQDTQKKTYEKVAVLGVKREAGYLYFLRGSDVYRTALNGPQNHGLPTPSTKTGAEKVAEGNFTRDPNYLYFIDESGDVSRVPRLASRPPEFVVGFLFDSDLKLVVLIRKRRPKWMNGRYNGVGGHVEEVVGEFASLFAGGFGGADLEAAVNGHGIGADELSFAARSAQRPREFERERAFARSGGAGDHDQAVLFESHS
jgi:hypothetical protein